MLNENEENICKVIQADFGFRNIIETQLAELTTIRQAANLAVKNLEMWTKPVPIKTPIHLWPSRSELLPEPKGIVGIMSPWNYPLSLALSPAIAAIAAGNQVWLKPSERSPRTSGYLAKLIAQYFNPIEISIITGNQQVAQAFADLPFDHLFFTGSTRVGQLVAQAAAANLTPVTLELGGKSPVIIDQSAALDDAARRLIYGKFFNAGQTCIAPDYLLVPRNQEKPLIEALKKSLQIMYPSGSGLTHPIDALQLDRWQNLLTDASQRGGQVVPLYDTTPIDYPFMPSLVLTPPSKALVTTQEIFGPILPIICYETGLIIYQPRWPCTGLEITLNCALKYSKKRNPGGLLVTTPCYITVIQTSPSEDWGQVAWARIMANMVLIHLATLSQFSACVVFWVFGL